MKRGKKNRRCAYCGSTDASTDDHVIPRALYPPTSANCPVQRITVPACPRCNKSWQDDEVHFRNMLLISGQPNAPVRELWDGKVRRSFAYGDGARRRRDLAARMMQVQAADGDRYVVYPARDKRVMRIVRKIIRGLCHHHELVSPVHDGQVWADVQRFEVPPAFVEEMTWAQAEKDVFQYRFGLIDDPDMHSCWLLRFFDRTSFFGIVFRSIEARARLESRAE